MGGRGDVASTDPSGVAARRRRPAFLIVLLGLFCVCMACVVVVFDVSMSVEETVAVQQQTVRRQAFLRRARARAAEDGTDRAARSATVSSASPTSGRESGTAQTSSRHAGGRPDIATPQGAKLFDDLVAAARGETDEKKRAGAVRSLAGMFGSQSSDALTGIAADPAQTASVRELATELRRRSVEGVK